MADSVLINGSCDPAFKAVCEALAQNLAEGDELGEVVSVVINGKTVVDLWGGYKDRVRTQPWERDTLVCMFSVGKPIAILAVLKLADQGRIDLNNRWRSIGRNSAMQAKTRLQFINWFRI